MRPRQAFLVLAIVGAGAAADAGGRWQQRRANVAAPPPMVTPNGAVVPTWAARRIENSTVPLSAPTYGRRPWAYALSMENTPSSRWAAASQLGLVGPGAIPGSGNGPGLGNYPQAAVGPNDQVVPPRRNPFFGFPINAAINGY